MAMQKIPITGYTPFSIRLNRLLTACGFLLQAFFWTMIKKPLTVLAFLFITTTAFSQDFLVLYKSGTPKKYVYPQGTTVRLTTKDSKKPFYARLDEIEKRYFLSGVDTVYFSDIHQLYLPEPAKASSGIRVLGNAMRIGGFGIVIVDLVNQGIIDEPFKANTGLWIAGVATGIVGFLPELISRKKRKVKGLWKVQKRTSAI